MEKKRINSVKARDMKALAEYQDKLVRKPRLRYLFFELTDRCNLRCLHCGSNCDPKKGNFLTFAVVEKTLQSIIREYDPKKVMVYLTGGEPLLHPDVFRVLHTAHRMGFPVGMTTNGTLIDDAGAEKLRNGGLATVSVSIDGTRKTHEAFRCSPGSFDRAMNGVKALKRQGFEPQVTTVANKMNLHNLQQLRDYLIDEGIDSWRILCIDPIGRAKENEELILDRTEMKELLEFIREMRYSPEIEMDVSFGCSHFLTCEYEREVRDFYYQCCAGLLSGSVMVNGDIGACLDIERREDLVQGNAYRDDFLTVWKERFQVFRTNRAEQSRYCADCIHKKVCRGDSAHTWDFDRMEPRYCFAKEREG